MRPSAQTRSIHVRPRSARARLSFRADGALIVHIHTAAAQLQRRLRQAAEGNAQ